jgi:phosphate transport system protein
MEMRLQKELEELKDNLFKMATFVEETIRDSVQSLARRDPELAQNTLKKKGEINSIKISIDNVCLKLLAFDQLMATDFRFISSAMKITTDLERMGDQAVNIAERAISLKQELQLKSYINIPRMAEIAQSMVKDALDAFVNKDSTLARPVWETDDLIDKLNDQVERAPYLCHG